MLGVFLAVTHQLSHALGSISPTRSVAAGTSQDSTWRSGWSIIAGYYLHNP
jgi:hypothetical protein